MGTADGYVGRLRTVRCGSGEVWVRAESGPGWWEGIAWTSTSFDTSGLPMLPCSTVEPCPVLPCPALPLPCPLLPATTDFRPQYEAKAACLLPSRLTILLHYLVYLGLPAVSWLNRQGGRPVPFLAALCMSTEYADMQVLTQ